jgi:hypothetical protein
MYNGFQLSRESSSLVEKSVLDIKCAFQFPLYSLYETSFSPINVKSVTLQAAVTHRFLRKVFVIYVQF